MSALTRARAPRAGGALSDACRTLGSGGPVGAPIAVALAYGLGGYTAGRTTRFDGVKNGLGVVLLVMLLTSMLGGRRGVDGHRTIDRDAGPQRQRPAA